jgi:colanic acid/amylovoran biosynthesis glycosyltransferase
MTMAVEKIAAGAAKASTGRGGETLLIYAPVPLYARADGTLLLEEQACNGLRLWAENFERLLVMMPIENGTPPPNWVALSKNIGAALKRIEIHPLPSAYRPDKFFAHLSKCRRQIRELIDRADYLSFAIGGLFGDWGAVACHEAFRMGRPYAVWTDRVESKVVRQGANAGPIRARLRAKLIHRPMALLESHLIRRASLGLFHGRETYEAYAPYCLKPEIVHDIHIARKDHIEPGALAKKIKDAESGRPLSICYVGRAEPMKGSLDWVEVLETVAHRSIDFEAVWLGEGSQYAQMKERVARAGLQDRIRLPGHTADRAVVLDLLRGAHIFLFCHKTPESPRCLIEALVSGCPIIGYDGAFARDLVSAHGGGQFAPLNNTAALAEIIAKLAKDRAHLGRLISQASKDGSPFEDVEVFRHRSMLIKQYL